MACMRRGFSKLSPTTNRALFTAMQPPPAVGAAVAPVAMGSQHFEGVDQMQREVAREAFRRLGLQMPLRFSMDDPNCRAEVLNALQVEDQAAGVSLAAARRAYASKPRTQGSDKHIRVFRVELL